MKTIKYIKLVVLFFAVLSVASCVKDDDYDTPDTSVQEPTLDGDVVEIGSVAGNYDQEGGNVTYEGTNTYMEGYVISSDEGGNYFEEIILQDKLENPTVGIRVLIDVNPLFTKYEVGRKVYVRLDGLTAGISNGVLTLGVAGSEFIEKIPAPLEEDVIIRSATVGTVVPRIMTIEELPSISNDADGYRYTNLFVQINDVQFNKNEVLGNNPLTYASEPGDEFDGERTLESCLSNESLVFSTSTFADFNGLLLPSGRGSVGGVLTKNFFGDEFNITVNDPTTVDLFDENRCDPVTGFYFDDFEAYNSTADLIAAGWTNENTSGGNTVWSLGDFDNNQYAQVSGFNSGENDIDAWLISPAINMDATSNEALTFDIQVNFDNGTILTVLYSTNFTGDINAATWTNLNASIPTGPSSGFGDFVPVGPIDLSGVDGEVHLAFFYEGSDPDATTRYHIDNVSVAGN